MKISASEIKKIIRDVLKHTCISPIELEYISTNLIEAEFANKRTHGLLSLPAIKKFASKLVSIRSNTLRTISESNQHLHLDGQYNPGYICMYQSLERAIAKTKNSGVVIVGIKNMSYSTGYLGAYARKATENDLIFIGFNKSPSSLVPTGASESLFGTNPITFGAPTENKPVIVDTSLGKITVSELLSAFSKSEQLEKNVAINQNGEITTDPKEALAGGILPIAGHKGSSLAFIGEILAGALINSMTDSEGSNEPRWGCFYILIDTKVFREKTDFKLSMGNIISRLKRSKKRNDQTDIFYPGEKYTYENAGGDKKRYLEIDDETYLLLQKLLLEE